MTRKNITIGLRGGLDASSAAHLVQVASQYDSSIYLERGSRRVNAKSIMGMMSLNLSVGEQLDVVADGGDEEMALAGMEAYVERGEQLVH